MHATHTTRAALLAAAALAACSAPTADRAPGVALGGDRAAAATNLRYGTPVKLGNGMARAYVAYQGGKPIEIGVALDERALDGLPAHDPSHTGPHHEMHEYLLDLPARHGTPYRFVELDWNPVGHEPDGVYTAPHFDFHFDKITVAERDRIDPTTNVAYDAEAAAVPAAEYVRPGWIPASTLANQYPGVVAVPRMGLHWLNPATSPELPPTLKPFTHTFIVGTWAGKVIFDEPMITRDFLLSKPDTTVALAVPQKHDPAGYYPASYSIRWDRTRKEWRVALGEMAYRN